MEFNKVIKRINQKRNTDYYKFLRRTRNFTDEHEKEIKSIPYDWAKVPPNQIMGLKPHKDVYKRIPEEGRVMLRFLCSQINLKNPILFFSDKELMEGTGMGLDEITVALQLLNAAEATITARIKIDRAFELVVVYLNYWWLFGLEGGTPPSGFPQYETE